MNLEHILFRYIKEPVESACFSLGVESLRCWERHHRLSENHRPTNDHGLRDAKLVVLNIALSPVAITRICRLQKVFGLLGPL
jgi:hypothetical protein